MLPPSKKGVQDAKVRTLMVHFVIFSLCITK